MFTRETARQLHDRLPAFSPGVAVSNDPLTQAYLSHYGLNRIQAPWPISHSLGYFESLHYRLACHYFAVPESHRKGTAIIVHGYYDHAGLFRHPVEVCLALGLSVLCFDLPGHGLSGGDPASIDSYDHYSQSLVDCINIARQKSIPGPFHLLAQSTGAATVINCLIKGQKFPLGPIDKIIFLAPLLRPAGWKTGMVVYWLLHLFVKQVKRGFTANSHDSDFLQFLAQDDPLQARYLRIDWVTALRAYLKDFAEAASSPITIHIIQGTGDRTVDWRYNLPKLAEKFPNAKIHVIEEARHHLVNESSEYREKIFAVVNEIFENG